MKRLKKEIYNSYLQSDSSDFIESDKSFKKRQYKFLYLGIGLEIFLIIFTLPTVLSGYNTPEICFGDLMFTLAIIIIGFVIVMIIKTGKKMKKFQIRDREFLEIFKKFEINILGD